jgi:hypothetical protein
MDGKESLTPGPELENSLGLKGTHKPMFLSPQNVAHKTSVCVLGLGTNDGQRQSFTSGMSLRAGGYGPRVQSAFGHPRLAAWNKLIP